jgi:uncharacterized membrane protein YeiB
MPNPQVSTNERIAGFDVARALAILGMMVVHFSLVMGESHFGPRWLEIVLGFLDGRAAATFAILAGVGVTLMSRRAVAGGEPSAIATVRKVLLRRAAFLLALGFVNLTIWQGDILRVYGVSLLLAAWLITSSEGRLLLAALACTLGFVALFLVLDFEKNWDWATLAYRGLWTATGLARNLFFDGFRSVFPWAGFLLFGMWLGRLDLLDSAVNLRVALAGAGTAIAAELASWHCVSVITQRLEGMDPETIKYVFGTESMPALPLFILASIGAATTIVAVCVRIGQRWPRLFRPLAATGQMALTWYAAHIVLGLGAVVALDLTSSQPLPLAAGCGVGFFAGAVLLSWLWKARFRHGPLEWLMRVVAG